MKTARRRKPLEPERVTPREFIDAWQSSSSVAEVAKKIGCLKKAVRVRAYRYRKLGIPLKDFPPVEWPDWDELADYAESLLPKKAVPTSAGKGSPGEEDRAAPPTAVEVGESAPVTFEGEEDSLAPVGEADAEPVARDGDAQSEQDAHHPSSEVSSEKTASREAE